MTKLTTNFIFDRQKFLQPYIGNGRWALAHAHSVTPMVASCMVERPKMPKINIKAKQKSSVPNSPKKVKKEPKRQTKNFKAKSNKKGQI